MASSDLSRLVLGTAQLGIPNYGVGSSEALADEENALAVLREALRSGIRAFDTANAYGRAEERLGVALRDFRKSSPEDETNRLEVVTKLAPLDDCGPQVSVKDLQKAVDRSVSQSMRWLSTDRLDVLLLHRSEHKSAYEGQIWKQLLAMREDGRIGRLGVSVYAPEEVAPLMEDPTVQDVQLPFNMLDHRWPTASLDEKKNARPDLRIHTRSLLLQGILVSPCSRWPTIPGFDGCSLERRLIRLADVTQSGGRLEMALDYARSQTWIDRFVLGVDSAPQVREAVRLFTRPVMSESNVELCKDELEDIPSVLLDPRLWPRS